MSGAETKQQILEAAEKVMGEKGKNARMSEIAALANVSDSVLYHYYKNKEDLLFSAAEARLTHMRNQLEDQLFGLKDPESKLRKLIWFRLSYLEKHRDYGELLMFECRSNLNFYKHSAFNRSLWFIEKLGEIIKQGIEIGTFKKHTNIWLVRDTVFGLLDLMNIESLVSGKNISDDDYEQVVRLILAMLICDFEKTDKNQETGKAREVKKLKIISAAEKIFAEYGYEKAKIQDIASVAGVADGTVYGHFKNKEDLLFAVLGDGFQPSVLKAGFQGHLSVIHNTETDNAIEKLQSFIRNHFMMCQTQPSFVKILILHGIYNRKFYSSNACIEFEKYLESVYPVLEQAKKEGLIQKDLNSEIFIKMILGAFSHITLRWQISENQVVLDKVSEINEIVRILITAVAV